MDVTRLPGRIATAAALIASGLGGWLFLLHLRMIVSPAPQEMREGAVVWITRLLLEGRNPYDLAELPASTNVYGIFYHLVVLPFAMIFGNGFTVHRTVSGLSILCACVLLYQLLRRKRTDRGFAFVGVLLFYASSLYFVAPLARPDSLGVLLSMASMTLLFRDNVTPIAFLLGLCFALMALATKIYLAYPPFIMAAYVFLYDSRFRGLAYGLTSAAAAVLLLFTLATFYPAYVNMSLVGNAQTGYEDAAHLWRQTSDWLVFSLPLTVALVLVAVRGITGAMSARRWRLRPDIFAFASAVNAGVFLYWLGWHPGAHMTYVFQLVTPALILAVWPHIGTRAWPRAVVTAALPLALVLNAPYFPLTFARFAAAEREFARVARLVEGHQNVLGSTEVAGLLALAGRPVVDSGQSEYFEDTALERPLPGAVPAALLHARWDGFVAAMADDISAERFDLIVRSRRHGLIPRDLVAEHYRVTDTVDLDFAWASQRWPVDLWTPRRRDLRHARRGRPQPRSSPLRD